MTRDNQSDARPSLWLVALLTLALITLNGCAQVIHITTSEPIQISPNKRTPGAKVDDRRIETYTRVNLKKASSVFNDSHINIDSHNGVLLLTGQVPSEPLRQLAGDTAKQLNTLRQINNELVVAPNASFSARSYDTWLTTKIKTKLLANSDIDSDRIRVVSENKSVFIMGLVSRYEADKIAQLVANTRGVAQVVKVFEYLD